MTSTKSCEDVWSSAAAANAVGRSAAYKTPFDRFVKAARNGMFGVLFTVRGAWWGRVHPLAGANVSRCRYS